MTEPDRPRPDRQPPPSPRNGTDGDHGAAIIARPVALALLMAVIIIWGVNWPIMKLTLANIPPLTFAVARLVLGGLCLVLVLIAQRRFRVPGREDFPIILSVGLLQLAAFLAFIHVGLMWVEAGRAAILSYTTMIWVTPLAVIFLGERLTRRKIAGLACGLGGIAALFNPLGFDWTDARGLAGNAFMLAGAFSWAIAILHIRAHRFKLSPLQLAPWQMLVALVPLALLAFHQEAGSTINWTPTLLASLAYNGALATGFALWAWLSLNRAMPAITTAMGSLGVPVVGLLASAVWLGEAINVTSAAGLLLISIGLALIMIDTARRPA